MRVRQVAQVPAPTVPRDATVLDAVRTMERVRGGAVCVMEGDRLVGVLTERDVLLKVVRLQRDPADVPVAEVMSADVTTVGPETRTAQALEAMVERHIRHLPVLADDGRLVGLVSVRNLLQGHVEYLVDQLQALESFVTADGPGG